MCNKYFWFSIWICIAQVEIAGAQIFQPGTQPVGKPGGIQVEMQTSSTCKQCHSGIKADDDYEPWESWRGAMMANAGRDPVFRAALSIAEFDNPSAADFCVRCHSAGAWLRGRSSVPAWSSTDGPRFAPDEENFLSGDLDGVACMVCHRAVESVPSDPASPHRQNAQMYFLDGDMAEVRQGPYAYTSGMPMPDHPTQQSTFHPRGDFCAQCHDIVNPVLTGKRADGSSTGRPFAIERTYSEWKHSAFPARDQTCQTCHMPEMAEDVVAAKGGVPRSYMRRHDLVGANHWVPKALGTSLFSSSAITEDVRALYDNTSSRALTMLRNAARLEIKNTQLDSGDVLATIRVTNLTGHKLPTGYPEGRRMWLEVKVVDAGGNTIDGSGIFDAATLTLAHDDQLRAYEAKLGENGVEGFHFVANNTTLLDTRIPPEGFVPPPELDMTPVGRDYSDGSGGYRNYDEVTFRLQACAPGSLTLKTRLLFQTTSREYIEFLRDTARDDPDPNIDNWGRIAYEAWQANGGGNAVELAAVTMPLDGTLEVCPPPMAPMSKKGCSVSHSAEHPWIEVAILLFAVLGVAGIRRRRARLFK